jgi:LmbE family N-acetylglucosaminyl deacetylase
MTLLSFSENRPMFARYSFGLVLALVILACSTEFATRQSQSSANEPAATNPAAEGQPLRIVVFGGHPDDPETGCGGLGARLTQAGHTVLIAYATCYRGDRKIGDEPEATVRRREATAACKELGATPHFFDYAHEKLFADEATLDTVASWLKEVQPDIVTTHWPLDTHPNHHVTSSLVWQAYLRERKWNLYFFEVMTDRQSLDFRPDLYLDIADVRDRKKDACFCHQSQNPEAFWAVHEDMHRRRGRECGAQFAEAFRLAEPLQGRPLIPLPLLQKTN